MSAVIKPELDESSTNEIKKDLTQATEASGAAPLASQSSTSEKSPDPGSVHTYNIFVGDLPPTITENQLRDHFSKFGEIKLVNIIRDKTTGSCKGTHSPSEQASLTLAFLFR
jgi:RNA recognition motif-containing protein